MFQHKYPNASIYPDYNKLFINGYTIDNTLAGRVKYQDSGMSGVFLGTVSHDEVKEQLGLYAFHDGTLFAQIDENGYVYFNGATDNEDETGGVNIKDCHIKNSTIDNSIINNNTINDSTINDSIINNNTIAWPGIKNSNNQMTEENNDIQQFSSNPTYILGLEAFKNGGKVKYIPFSTFAGELTDTNEFTEDYVSKTNADTMAGNLTIKNSSPGIIAKNNNIDRTQTFTTTTNSIGFRINDQNDKLVALYTDRYQTDGYNGAWMCGRRDIGNNTVYNSLQLLIDSEGHRQVSITAKNPWRIALGLGQSDGTLPITIEQGGTGATNAAAAWTALGGGASGQHPDNYYALAGHNHDIISGTANYAVTANYAKTANSASKYKNEANQEIDINDMIETLRGRISSLESEIGSLISRINALENQNH